MKVRNLLFILLLLFSLGSCWLEPGEKSDRKIFTNIGPTEWSDDYVFSATNYPCSIQIWDSVTNSLVKDISLTKDGRSLDIMDMALLDKSIWIIGYGKTYNLIRIDIESGDMEFKDFSYDGFKSKPYSLASLSKEQDGVGTLWVKSYGNPDNGTLFAKYDADGVLLDTFCVQESIRHGLEMNVVFFDDQYYMLGPAEDTICINDNSICYYVINLSRHEIEKEMRYTDFFGENFMEEKLGANGVSEFLTNAWLTSGNKLDVLILNSDGQDKLLQQALFGVSYDESIEVDYLNVHLDDKYVENMASTESKYRILYYNGNPENDFAGLELGVFNKETGNQEKVLEIPDANRVFLQEKNGVTWISLNSFKYAGNGYVNPVSIPEICKFDHATGQVYVYTKDGAARELQYTDILQ